MAAATIDLAKFPAAVNARWFDPTTGRASVAADSPFANATTREFTPPGLNAAGDPDWALVLEVITR